MQIQSRQFRIEIHQTERQRDGQVDEGAGKGVANGLACLAGALGRRCEASPLTGLKALLKSAEMK